MTAIDLTHRIIQTPPPAPRTTHYHAWRRVIQVGLVALIVGLPLINGLRVDVRSGASFLLGHRLAGHDSLSVFCLTMLGIWALVTVSFLYGRLWCGYACPQTLASDFADSLKQRLDRVLRARRGRPQFLVSRAAWSAVIVAVSVGAGAISVCYFLDPAAVGRSLIRPASDPTAAAWIFGIAALLGADMLWVRRKLCAGVCQYGALIGLLADENTLAVRYLEEREDDCIHCHRCEVVCPMEIDIKKGVGQIGCIGCGECVDACNDVLGRRGVAGVIEHRYGAAPERTMASLSWKQRLGLWDAKRIAVVVVMILCVASVGVVGWASFPSSLSITANGAVERDSGLIRDGYTLAIRNGSPDPRVFRISLGDPMLRSEPDTVTLDGHDSVMIPVNVVASDLVIRKVVPLTTTLEIVAGRERLSAPIVFVAPR